MDSNLASERPADNVARAGVPNSRYALFFAVVAAGLAVDLATKHLCFASPYLCAGNTWWLWQGHVGFQLSLNEGRCSGLGRGMFGYSRP